MKSALLNQPVYPVEDYEEDLRFHRAHLEAMNERESSNIALVVAVVVACLFSAAVGAAAVTWMTAHNAERVAQ